jgi:hypothetical protein
MPAQWAPPKVPEMVPAKLPEAVPEGGAPSRIGHIFGRVSLGGGRIGHAPVFEGCLRRNGHHASVTLMRRLMGALMEQLVGQLIGQLVG